MKKQQKKRMITAKKGAVLAATTLIMSNSPVVVMTALAENNNVDSGVQSVVQQEKTIDDSVYSDNVLPPLEIVNNQLQNNWSVVSNNSAIETTQLTDGGYPVFNQTDVRQGMQVRIFSPTKAKLALTNYPIHSWLKTSVSLLKRTYSYDFDIEGNMAQISIGAAGGWIESSNGKITGTCKGKDSMPLRFAADGNLGATYSFITFNINSFKLMYGEQWRQIDKLFTSLDQTELAPGVTLNAINQVKAMVNSIENNQDATEMNDALTKAEALFEEKVVNAVDSLFDNGQLTPSITQEMIDEAQGLINQLVDGEKKKELQNKLNQAQELLTNQQNAQEAVDKLFGNNGQLSPNVTLEMIKEVQALIDKVTDINKKQELQNKLDKAQKLYNQKLLAELTVMVNHWFTDASHTALKEGVTADDIGKAIVLLEQLPESNEKDNLRLNINIAQTLLNKHISNEEARKAVESLFTDGTHTKLAEKTTKEIIDNVKTLVYSLEDVTVRNELSNLIEKAYGLLENKTFTITKIDTYKEGETKLISGTYAGNNAAYIRLVVNGKKESLVSLKTSKGTFQYYRAGLKATDKVSVVIYDAKYYELAQKEVTIIPGNSTQIVSVSPYVEGKDIWITGKYEGLAPAYIGVTVNGVKKASVSFKGTTDNTFKYYLPGLKGTDKVEVSLFNDGYQEVARQTIQVTAVDKVEITSIDTYKPGVSSWVTGKVSGTAANYMQLMVNGQKTGLVSSKDLASGTFRYYKAGLKSTDKVEIILYNKNYQEVARKEVPMEDNTPAKITSVDPYEVGKSEWITGKIKGDTAAHIRVVVNGEKKALLTFKNIDSTFKYYMAGLKVSDKVEVEIFDNEFKKLDQMAVPFK